MTSQPELISIDEGTAANTFDLWGTPYDALGERLESIGISRHHAHRVFRSTHGRGQRLEEDPEFGWRNLARLRTGTRAPLADCVEISPAPDGSQKMLFRLGHGGAVEAVLIPGHAGRITLCLSSQVGCGVGCHFCATAKLGLSRSLTTGEIIAQVHAANQHLAPARVSHVVFMGMGEPLQNYPAVRDTIRILLDSRGPCLEARRITVSTVGLTRKMRTFSQDFGGRVQLALSLHAGTDETRERIIPLAKKYPLDSLRQACLEHPLPGSRHLMLEYVVLPGVNDTEGEAAGVARWVRGLRCVVNLVPFNPFGGAEFRSPSDEEVHRFAAQLRDGGVPVTIRWPRGRGVNAACGQLALNRSRPGVSVPQRR